MIKIKDGKYYVYSEKGKLLSKAYNSYDEAKKRLQEIEYFKSLRSPRVKYRKNK